MIRGAIISDCGAYRMQLIRALPQEELTTAIQAGPGVAWVLNNPSTADALTDDPTVRKCWKFTRAWGFASMMFVNTNPHRATDPKAARMPPEEVLVANDSWLQLAASNWPYVIAAWGDKANPVLAQRAINVIHPLGPLHAMRVTKAGNPQHPLYLPGSTLPQIWKPTGLN